MKALLATCIAGAITFTGTIYLVGGSRPSAAVPDAKPVAVHEAAASFEPSVPGRSPTRGFPDDRISFWDHSPDAGAEKTGGPVLAAVAPEQTAGPETGAASSGSIPAAVSTSSLTVAQPESPAGPTPSAERAPAPPVISAPTVLAKAVVGDDSVETNPRDSGHRDAAQLVPTNCDASIDTSRAAPATQDFRYLICYVWSETPPAEKPAATVLRSLKDIPVGTPLEEIKRASDAFGLDFNFMKAVAKIESGFDPKQRTGSYIGLFQLSKYEFGKFGSGDILNPRDNAVAAAYKIVTEGILFQWVTGRKPDLSDLYLIHQQGWEGAAEHLSRPDRIAWKSMCATSEGREKGEKWCRRAIWGNTLPAVKSAWKSVEKLTSEAFVGMWRERVAYFQAKYMGTATAEAAKN